MTKYYAKDYRRIATEKCKPYSGTLAIIWLIYYAITAGINGVLSPFGKYEITQEVIDESGNVIHEATYGSVGSNIGSLIIFVLGGAFALSFINVIKDVFSDRKPEAEQIFSGFRMFVKCFVLYLLQSIFTFLWSLLLIIPGIIKAYSYSMSFFLFSDNPELSSNDAITKSKELMNGHKWDLFCLDLSYLGWLLLSALTLGILLLWVMPKMQAAHYAFYLHITGKDVAPMNPEIEAPMEDDTPEKKDDASESL